MSNISLVFYFQQLSTRDKSRFRKFVDSPYFNADKRLLSLLDHIRSLLDKEQYELINREYLFECLYPNQDFEYNRISLALSDLNRLFEAFLAQEMIKGQSARLKLHLMEGCIHRRFDKLFLRTSKKLEKEIQKTDLTHEEQFLLEYEHRSLLDDFVLGRQNRTMDHSLIHKIQHLERFYVAKMLTDLCEWTNRNNILRQEAKPENYDRFIQFIQANYTDYEDTPYITIHYHALMSLIEWDQTEHFFQLKTMMEQFQDTFTRIERKEMYQYASNYCIRQINSGNTEFLPELFNIYRKTLEQGLQFEGGFLSPHTFKNMVSLGIRLKEFDWTRTFLEDYAPYLPEESKEQVMVYNQAYYHYSQGEYRTVLRLLRELEFSDIYYQLGAKVILLKVYYDLGEWDALEALLHSFESYLRRNKKASDYQIRIHLNLISYVRKLYNILQNRGNQTHIAIQNLAEEVRTKREITNVNWLEEKLSEALRKNQAQAY